MTIAHKGAVVGVKVIAGVGARLAYLSGIVDGRRSSSSRSPKTQVFFSTPTQRQTAGGSEQKDDGQVPPSMRKFYLNKKAQFK
jgi:hypothetical protein